MENVKLRVRIGITLVLCSVLAGCPQIIKGLVKNDSGESVFHITHWKPIEEVIPEGEARKVRLFSPGACIELLVAGESRYYIVPVPPPGSKIGNKTYSVTLNEKGLFYTGSNIQPVQFSQESDCG